MDAWLLFPLPRSHAKRNILKGQLKETKQKTAHIHKEKIGRKLDYLVTSFTETTASHSKIRLKVESGEITDNKFRKDHGALNVWLTMAAIPFQ